MLCGPVAVPVYPRAVRIVVTRDALDKPPPSGYTPGEAALPAEADRNTGAPPPGLIIVDAIRIEGLTKRYHQIGKRTVHALAGIELTVQPNEVFGFLGRNGAGKTTTIKILCGLIKPTAGHAWVFGENANTRAARRLFGYLPEQPYFYEYLTPRETVDFYGRLQGLDRTERARTWDRLSELLDLRDIAEQRVKGFSKGMRQRLGFAVALVGDPNLLILDEPMSGLDPLGRRQIRELMLRLRDEGKTLFFSSHVLGDVEQVCDRVALVRDGRVRHAGRLDALLGQGTVAVELIVEGVPAPVRDALAARATHHRTLDEQERYVWPDHDAANAAAREVLDAGGRVVALSPIRETLEDFFMREQEAQPAA